MIAFEWDLNLALSIFSVSEVSGHGQSCRNVLSSLVNFSLRPSRHIWLE